MKKRELLAIVTATLYASGGWDTWCDAMEAAGMLIDDARKKVRKGRWWCR